MAHYSDSAGESCQFTQFENIELFINFVFRRNPKTMLQYLEKHGANIVVGQCSGFKAQKGNAFDILTDIHLREAQSIDTEDSMGKELFYSELPSKHIHSVNSPGDVLILICNQ